MAREPGEHLLWSVGGDENLVGIAEGDPATDVRPERIRLPLRFVSGPDRNRETTFTGLLLK